MINASLHGLMAEFESVEALVGATQAAYERGYRAMDAYSPFPVEELSEALGFQTRAVPLLALAGGLTGVITGFGMQAGIHSILLPINVGGRPLVSWPAFIPVTFEMGVLFSALFTLVGLLVLNRLPEPYHPVFNVPEFARATRDRFFLCIEARDPAFDPLQTRQFLLGLGAREVSDVPR
jgi:Protein of unknown function (DUF3341)